MASSVRRMTKCWMRGRLARDKTLCKSRSETALGPTGAASGYYWGLTTDMCADRQTCQCYQATWLQHYLRVASDRLISST